uniref:Uncharacterized protein n=2 Tax=Lotharella globosa TaxID=91324 RepID=A0A7S3YL81_9EUKA|mmetsp:Transcript_752/g.1455  ORF Transcript_752/g.1455 Transcript_752/m.1455 type:complete len:210 (+) Transcript_752:281-910(+)
MENGLAEGGGRVVLYGRRGATFAEPREGGWIKHDGIGLKGTTATWARAIGLGPAPPTLDAPVRFACVTEDDPAMWEETVKKDAVGPMVFATGFEPVPPPAVYLLEGQEIDATRYNPRSGRIADGLYGFGIGFPEEYTDPEDEVETRVGFTPNFVKHVQRALVATEEAKVGRVGEKSIEDALLASGAAAAARAARRAAGTYADNGSFVVA